VIAFLTLRVKRPAGSAEPDAGAADDQTLAVERELEFAA